MNLAERSCVIIPGGRGGEGEVEGGGSKGEGELEEEEVDALLFVPNLFI